MTLSNRLLISLITFFALAALPLISQYYGSVYALNLATRIIIFALAALSLDLILGYGGMVSFGHAAYLGLGGYAVAIASFHLSEGTPLLGWEGSNEAIVTLPLAMLFAGFIALIVGYLSLRTSGVHFIMITLAFAQMIFFVFISLKYYGGDDGLNLNKRNVFPFFKTMTQMQYYYFCLSLLALIFFIFWRLVNSRFGMVLRGAKASERRMKALGFPVFRYRLTAFVLSGMVAGLAGALWVNQARFVSTELLHWSKSGELMIMVILGGLNSLIGAILGAATLIILETWLAGISEHWELWLGIILIAVVLFTKGGVFGILEKLLSKLRGQNHA